jgi:hypothetical protein
MRQGRNASRQSRRAESGREPENRGKGEGEKKLRQVFLFAFLLEARYRAIEQEKEERP